MDKVQIFKNMVGIVAIAVLTVTTHTPVWVLAVVLAVSVILDSIIGMCAKVARASTTPLGEQVRKILAAYSPVNAVVLAVCFVTDAAVVAHHGVYGLAVYGLAVGTGRMLKRVQVSDQLCVAVRAAIVVPYAITAGLGIVYVVVHAVSLVISLSDEVTIRRTHAS